MMDHNVKKDIEEAIREQLDQAEDNISQAKYAAKSADVNRQWGHSGQTLQQIIDGYQEEVDRWKRALIAISDL